MDDSTKKKLDSLEWGVFTLKVNGFAAAVHVAPCDAKREVRSPHTLEPDCVCMPDWEFQPGALCPLYVHNLEQ